MTVQSLAIWHGYVKVPMLYCDKVYLVINTQLFTLPVLYAQPMAEMNLVQILPNMVLPLNLIPFYHTTFTIANKKAKSLADSSKPCDKTCIYKIANAILWPSVSCYRHTTVSFTCTVYAQPEGSNELGSNTTHIWWWCGHQWHQDYMAVLFDIGFLHDF